MSKQAPYLETNFFILHVNDLPNDKMASDLTDEEFMDISEKYGRVLNLNEFQAEWNNEAISEVDTYIRIIDVPIWSKEYTTKRNEVL